LSPVDRGLSQHQTGVVLAFPFQLLHRFDAGIDQKSKRIEEGNSVISKLANDVGCAVFPAFKLMVAMSLQLFPLYAIVWFAPTSYHPTDLLRHASRNSNETSYANQFCFSLSISGHPQFSGDLQPRSQMLSPWWAYEEFQCIRGLCDYHFNVTLLYKEAREVKISILAEIFIDISV
jgi:hypothetical protein